MSHVPTHEQGRPLRAVLVVLVALASMVGVACAGDGPEPVSSPFASGADHRCDAPAAPVPASALPSSAPTGGEGAEGFPAVPATTVPPGGDGAESERQDGLVEDAVRVADEATESVSVPLPPEPIEAAPGAGPDQFWCPPPRFLGLGGPVDLGPAGEVVDGAVPAARPPEQAGSSYHADRIALPSSEEVYATDLWLWISGTAVFGDRNQCDVTPSRRWFAPPYTALAEGPHCLWFQGVQVDLAGGCAVRFGTIRGEEGGMQWHWDFGGWCGDTAHPLEPDEGRGRLVGASAPLYTWIRARMWRLGPAGWDPATGTEQHEWGFYAFWRGEEHHLGSTVIPGGPWIRGTTVVSEVAEEDPCSVDRARMWFDNLQFRSTAGPGPVGYRAGYVGPEQQGPLCDSSTWVKASSAVDDDFFHHQQNHDGDPFEGYLWQR